MLSKIFTTVKYTLVVVNFLFLITGIIILAVGASVQAAYNAYAEFLTHRFFSLPAFCIATGVIILLIAIVGFYGALMENYTLNMIYVGAMVIIFIFQLAACIAGYALKGNTLALIQTELTNSMELYNHNDDVTALWDEVQQDFECCGVTNASDWLQHVTSSRQAAVVPTGIPVSCCLRKTGTVGVFECNVSNAFDSGCATAFGNWVRGHVATIGIAGVFLVLMQGAAMGGAFWIAKMSRQEAYLP